MAIFLAYERCGAAAILWHCIARLEQIMRRPTSLPAAALAAGLSLSVPATSHAAVVDPSPGIYLANGLYTAVVASSGAKCPSPGDSLTLYFTYPGPAKGGATFHETGLTSGVFAILTGVFPKTPAAGVTDWSGKVMETTSAGVSHTVVFSATLQFNNASSFLATFDWNETGASGGTCKETIQVTLIKSGHL